MVDEARARVDAAQRSMELYKLSYEFTKVLSPIDGQISRYYMTKGNLVNQDQTLLTTVVSVDPMYVYFEVDEPTLDAIPEGRSNERKGESTKDRADAGLHGAARGDRLPAPGDRQPGQQPEQCSDGHHSAASCIPEPAAQGGPATDLARYVRAESACRSACRTGRSWCEIERLRRIRG